MIDQTWPSYLGPLENSAPGHRFQLYFPKGPSGGSNLEPLQWAADYKDQAREQLTKLRERQAALAAAARVVTFDLKSSAPLATGLGNEHISDNGFAFLTPYGLPYIPGSGIKGAVRRAAEELARSGDSSWSTEAVLWLFGMDDKAVDRSEEAETKVREALGLSQGGDLRNRGALLFWDCLPEPPAGKLVVDVMNAHTSHYLQGNEAPHQTMPPNPIYFLTLPPGTGFRFHVGFRPVGKSPAALEEQWRGLLDQAFEQAGWLGLGAKTSVGYGVMAFDEQARAHRREKERESEEAARRAAELAAMDPLKRSMQEAIEADPDPNKKDFMKLIDALERGMWEGEERREVVQRVRALMQEGKEWVEESKKPAKDKKYQRTQKVLAWLKS